jgi:Skp family chaperone for outer membrane proteins
MKSVTIAVIAGSVLAAVSATAQQPAAPASSFPAGAKFAYVDIQRVAGESEDGQAANVRVQELSQQKVAEIEAKNTEMQGQVDALNAQLLEQQTKLQQGQNVMSAEARLALQREISRLQVEVQRTTQDSQAEMQRFTQDAEAAVQELQQELQIEFQKKLVPVIELLVADKGLSFIFSVGDGLTRVVTGRAVLSGPIPRSAPQTWRVGQDTSSGGRRVGEAVHCGVRG